MKGRYLLKMGKRNMNKFTVEMKFDLNTMDQIIIFLYDDSSLVNRKNISNIWKLFNAISETSFENDDELLYRRRFIRRTCYAYLKKGLREINILYDYASEGQYKEEIDNNIQPMLDNYQMPEAEANYVINLVSERLKYIYLYQYKDKLVDTFEDLETGNFDSLEEINNDAYDVITKVLTKIRKAKADESESDSTFDLSDKNSFHDIVSNTWKSLRKPSNKLKTGFKLLDKMASGGKGGFESGRVFLFLGITGGFKSGLLLTLTRTIRSFNKGYKTKDPSKVPTVLYITQENSMKETIQRLYLMQTGKNLEDVKSQKVVFETLKNSGMYPNKDEVNIVMVYKPNRSISTDDLYDIIQEQSDEGKEVICLVHDYIKRIRSSEPNSDLRIELGNIANEFSTLAKHFDIPVITASQLNRNAFKTLEASLQANKADSGKLLNISDIGESMLMLENVDFVSIIHQEYKRENNIDYKYLTFKEGKVRGGQSRISYFAHPFEEENWLKLIEDGDMDEPVSVLELSDSHTIDTSEEINNLINGKKTTRKFQKKLNATKEFNRIKTPVKSTKSEEEELITDDIDYLADL